MRLKSVLKGIDAKFDPYLRESSITSIAANSKAVKRGSLFVAIKGSRFDGHKFIGEATRKGARAILVEGQKSASCKSHNVIRVKDARSALSIAAKNFYGSPSEKLKTVGITGTNGKTTTSALIESIFNESRIRCGVIGTIEYKIGSRRIPAARTTPSALLLNELLAKMVKSKLKAAVMEVSSHALHQGRVRHILFNVAIFTNLTHEHLDYHGDLKRYFASKVRIFENLKKGGVAIINVDDKYVKGCIKKIKNHRFITYGLDDAAYISSKVDKLGARGTSFIVRVGKVDAFNINTKLVGLHNVSNILAATAAGVSQGIDFDSIKKGIEKVNIIPGRLESVNMRQGFSVFIDYAHTHNALLNVLKFLNQIKSGNIITVFGCGGDRDKSKRPLMGKVVQRFSDFFIITDDNPRNESSQKIIRDIETGLNKKKSNYTVISDRKKAIEKALGRAKTGDIVLLAGKGHERTQIIGDREISFSDRKIAENILRKLN